MSAISLQDGVGAAATLFLLPDEPDELLSEDEPLGVRDGGLGFRASTSAAILSASNLATISLAPGSCTVAGSQTFVEAAGCVVTHISWLHFSQSDARCLSPVACSACAATSSCFEPFCFSIPCSIFGDCGEGGGRVGSNSQDMPSGSVFGVSIGVIKATRLWVRGVPFM